RRPGPGHNLGGMASVGTTGRTRATGTMGTQAGINGIKGVVLAGGSGSRLDPLTRVTNKHLLPVHDKPMIFYPIEALRDSGVDEILVVTGGNDPGDFLRLLGNGRELGLRHIEYAYQQGNGGIAHALALAENFAAGGLLCVMLGDNIV